MNRHHQSRRSNSSIAPKGEPGGALPPPLQPHQTAASPKNRPTPSSHSNSPSNTGSAFSPAASDNASLRSSMTGVSRQPIAQMPATGQPPRQPPMLHTGAGSRNGPAATGAAYYPTPAFQNHIEQLGTDPAPCPFNVPLLTNVGAEQEYDAQPDMLEDSEIGTPGGPGPYPAGFNGNGGQPVLLSPASSAPGHQVPQPHEQPHHPQVSGQQYPSMTQLLDQNIDWDPFGLSASMAFPTQQFQFDQGNMR